MGNSTDLEMYVVVRGGSRRARARLVAQTAYGVTVAVRATEHAVRSAVSWKRLHLDDAKWLYAWEEHRCPTRVLRTTGPGMIDLAHRLETAQIVFIRLYDKRPVAGPVSMIVTQPVPRAHIALCVAGLDPL